MDFKNRQQQLLKEQLYKYELPEELVDKIVLHSDDNWIEQLIIKLDKAKNPTEALAETLKLFMLKSFSNTPAYIAKKDITKIFPISMRKVEDMIRKRLIPIAVELNNKNRIFNIDELYNHFEKYKVDSIVNRVDPILLHQTLASIKDR